MQWLIGAAIACLVVWWLWRRNAQPAQSDGVRARLGHTVTGVKIARPILPDGLEAELVAAMTAFRDVNGIEIPSPLRGLHMSLAGESFRNPDGTTRQSIIEATKPGTVAWFVPEPGNEYDQDAIRVVVDRPDGSAAQLGYFPRGYGLFEAAHAGRIAAWFCSKRRSGDGQWCAVIYVIEAS